MARYAPDGWHSVTPRLVVEDPEALVAFLRHAFGAAGEQRPGGPAELTIGDSIVMVSAAGPRPAMQSALYLYVEDADATYRRTLAAGAESLEEPFDTPYGDRRAMVRDPAGNTWQIATRRNSVSGER